MLRKRKRKTIPTTAEGPEKYRTSRAARVGEEASSSSCCTSEEINFRPRHRWSHSGLPRGQSDIWEPARVPQPPQSSGWTKWKLGLIPDPTSRGSPYQQAGDRWPSALLVVGLCSQSLRVIASRRFHWFSRLFVILLFLLLGPSYSWL